MKDTQELKLRPENFEVDVRALIATDVVEPDIDLVLARPVSFVDDGPPGRLVLPSGSTVELSKDGPTCIGRSTYRRVQLFDPKASRKHAEIVRRAGAYAIRDIGSPNGTFVNDNR